MIVIPIWAQRLLSLIQLVYNIVLGIQAAQAEQATANMVTGIGGAVSDIIDTVDSPVYGNAAMLASQDAQFANITSIVDDIQVRVTDIQATLAAGVTVSAVGNTGAEAIAAAVWAFDDAVVSKNTMQLLEIAGMAAEQRGFPQVIERSPFSEWPWKVVGTWGEGGVSDPDADTFFSLDFSSIIASDQSCSEWLLRAYPSVPWVTLTGDLLGINETPISNWTWIVDIPRPEWFELKAGLGLGGSAASTAPVWPGIANVILGTPVAIAEGVTITTPMAGILVSLTSVPSSRGSYTFDDVQSFLNIGAVVFFSDNGDEEHPQNLGFTNEVYLVRTMVEAAGVKVRTSPGLVGTVTPFTLS